MKAKVDKEKCINCGLCYAMVPEVFELDLESGKAQEKQDVDHNAHEAAVQEAIDACPVDAISNVDQAS